MTTALDVAKRVAKSLGRGYPRAAITHRRDPFTGFPCVDGLAAAHGCTAEAEYRKGASATVNHAEQTKVAAAAASALVGEAAVNTDMTPGTGAEDFGLMLEACPGNFMFIGGGNGPDGTSPNLHTPHFNFNDDIIPLGVAYWVSVVEQEMGSPRG